MLTLKQTRNELERTLAAYGRVMQRDGAELLRRAFRNITRRVLAITPPSSAASMGEGMTLSRDAYFAGAARISRQMQNVLVPVRLKRKRRERHPDVAGLYRGLVNSNDGRMRLKTQFVGRKHYVDIVKYRAVLKDRQARVGRMASGWAAAAGAAGLSVPAWVSRHGGARGKVQSQLTGPVMGLRATNFAPTASPAIRAELARRIPYAMAYERASMRRQIDHLARTHGGALGRRARSALPGLAA